MDAHKRVSSTAEPVQGGSAATAATPRPAPEALQLPPGEGWHGVGSGWGTYAEALAARLGDALLDTNPRLLCSAHDVALLAAAAFREGEGVPAERGLPVYLRDRVAWKKSNPAAG